MKISFKQEQPVVIVTSSILLLVCAILTIWTGASKLVIIAPDQPIRLGSLWGVVELFVAIIFIFSGYSIYRGNLETGALTVLFSSLTLTLWYYMAGATVLAVIFEGIAPLVAGLIALSAQKETRRKIWLTTIKGTWEDFSHNRIGLVGLGIILSYVAVAFLQPYLATHDPSQTGLADKYAMPEWMAIINPALNNLPRTTDYLLDWYNSTSLPEEVAIEWNSSETGKQLTIRYEGNETIVVPLYLTFNYPYDPPKRFSYHFTWGAKPGLDAYRRATAKYSLELNLTTPDGKVFPLWDQHWWEYKAGYCTLPNPFYDPLEDPFEMRTYPGGSLMTKYQYPYYWKYKEHVWDQNYTLQPAYILYREWEIPIPTWGTSQSNKDVTYTVTQYPPMRLGYESFATVNMTRDLFSPTGEFTITLYVTFEPTQPNGSCQVTITNFEIHVPGLLWGLLGTEEWGRDCWSRLVWGTRVSLAVGIAASLVSVSIGLLVGLVAGYYGGMVDEGLMRLVDILLCLPLLPILMLLVTFWGRNIIYIVVIIAIFGWQGLSRMVRSQVLSLREMPFIECAKASGASRAYVIVRHLLPNVMPIVLASLVLSVPGAILLEAALSFIGFGDVRTPTWGREYAMMQIEGASPYDAWWWMVPPGIAITILCIGFVFVGHAIDEIVNPKLRRRR